MAQLLRRGGCLLVLVGIALFSGPTLAQQGGNGISPTLIPGPSHRGPITVNDPLWTEFSFFGLGNFAIGCQPADPAGGICTPSSGGNSQFGDAPPWTLTTAVPVTLTVTDCFDYGDGFEVFDNAVSIGTTSASSSGGGAGSDPDACLVDASSSSGTFVLPPGSHSITMQVAFGNSGAAYFRADTAPAAPTLPQWSLILMFVLLLAGGTMMLLRRGKASAQ